MPLLEARKNVWMASNTRPKYFKWLLFLPPLKSESILDKQSLFIKILLLLGIYQKLYICL